MHSPGKERQRLIDDKLNERPRIEVDRDLTNVPPTPGHPIVPDTLERFDYVEPESIKKPSAYRRDKRRSHPPTIPHESKPEQFDNSSISSSSDMGYNSGTPFSQGNFTPNNIDQSSDPHQPHFIPPGQEHHQSNFTPHGDFNSTPHHMPFHRQNLPPHPQTPNYHPPLPMTPSHPHFNDFRPGPPHEHFGHNSSRERFNQGPRHENYNSRPPHPSSQHKNFIPHHPHENFGQRPIHDNFGPRSLHEQNFVPHPTHENFGSRPPHENFGHGAPHTNFGPGPPTPRGAGPGHMQFEMPPRFQHPDQPPGSINIRHPAPVQIPPTNSSNHHGINSQDERDWRGKMIRPPLMNEPQPILPNIMAAQTTGPHNLGGLSHRNTSTSSEKPLVDMPKEIPVEKTSEPDTPDAEVDEEPRFMSLESRIQSLLQGGGESDDREEGKSDKEAGSESDVPPSPAANSTPKAPIISSSHSESTQWDPSNVHHTTHGPPSHMSLPHNARPGQSVINHPPHSQSLHPPHHQHPPHNQPQMIHNHPHPPQNLHQSVNLVPSGGPSHMRPPLHSQPGMDLWTSRPNNMNSHSNSSPWIPASPLEAGHSHTPHPLNYEHHRSPPQNDRHEKERRFKKKKKKGGNVEEDNYHQSGSLFFDPELESKHRSSIVEYEQTSYNEDSIQMRNNGHTSNIDDDRMSLDSVSSGEERLVVNPSDRKPQGYSNFDHETDFVTNMFSQVLREFVSELKGIMQKDLCKKMIETSAFKYFEHWWDQESEKNKVCIKK